MKARFHDALVNLAAHPIAWPLAQLSRAAGPIHTLPIVGVVVNDFELAHDVLQRDDEFTKNGKGSIAGVMTQALGPFALSNMDGEAHRQLRSTLGNDLLSPARCDALLRECRAPIDDAERALRSGRHVDLVEMMRTLSGRLTMAMMGITPPTGTIDTAARDIYALGERIAASLQFHPMSARRLQTVDADLRRLTAYASDAYASSTLPETSLLFRLREIGLSAEEARGVISIFFIAGALTTAVALPRIVALLVDSGQMSALADGDGALARAVEEGLRYTVPVPATVRIARRAATLGHCRIRAGSRLFILTANLARDARLFPAPHRFDVTRRHDPRARHLWYGAGAHFCLGFPLAQRELRLVTETLARLPGSLRIVSRRPAFGVLLPAYARMVVRLERA